MSNLIYRDDAIEALEKTHNNAKVWEVKCGVSEAIYTIKALPAAEAVHKPDYSYEADMVKRLRQAESVQGETVPVKQVKVNNFKVDEIPDDWEPSILGKQKRHRKKIYIAGPVTGVEGYEETFEKAADVLRAKGYEPVSPVAPGIVEGWTYRDYINRGFNMLMDCDGILLLPGYMDSKGAALELHYALAVGMELIRGFDHADDQERNQ